MTPPLGIIEGYYGAPWSWQARMDQVSFLAPHGYSFYLYAPKADVRLRKDWRLEHDDDEAAALAALAAHCRTNGVRFGVGLSPFEIYRDFNAETQGALKRKLAHLDSIGIEDLALLFDDMRGDLPGLADSQARIIDFVASTTGADRLIVCPTYYSDDRGLDVFFGARPPGYLEALGDQLDPVIEMFWTGEEVCSREFSPGHLARVTEQMRRKPMLWDNYPVNDGPRMSPYLYVRGFTGRPAAIGNHISGHAINPALQPVLTRIPALTLAESYRLGDAYQYGAAFEHAAEAVLGRDLAIRVRRHLTLLNDTGRDALGDRSQRLREAYAAHDHDGAREIVDWLDGKWVFTPNMFEGA